MVPTVSMFPHDKLDWNLSRLEKKLADGQTDTETRLAYARANLSKGRFHAGGEQCFTEALTQGRRVLHHEPGHPEGLVLSALALVLLDRGEPASRYLESALESAGEDPVLHVALGELALQSGNTDDAVHAFQEVCRLAPDAWESHLLLGHLLAELAEDPSASKRRIERAQYHLVRALQLDPSKEETPALQRALALLCLRTDRTADGHRLFTRLLDHPDYRAEARYHLGRVAARLGKHKKAILSFHQHLSETTDERAAVWSRIGASYLHLGEPERAREACNRALALDDDDLEARWVLGAAMLEEGQPEEAIRVFREILELAPDHQDAFAELVRLRTAEQDVRWLRQALRSETAVYDRLPVRGWRVDPRTGREVAVDPRSCTRSRIDVLIRGLGTVDSTVTNTVLGCLDLTTDEGLRFRLWEGVLELLARRKAAEMGDELRNAGQFYSAAAGRDVLTLSHLLTEEELTAGLNVGEEDLRKAAVQRHGPAPDVLVHRANVAQERREARAWQALLLLAIANRRSPTARNLLVRWASDADAELGLAARAGLAMSGDQDAAATIDGLAAELQITHLAKQALAPLGVPDGPDPARLVKDQDKQVCATCARRGSQAGHMIVGHGTAVCNVCMATIWERRNDLMSRDPDLACALTGATLLDVDALYFYQGVPVSSTCVDLSIGHDERETIASYLASL
jgi:tetratricopeptide (TPR) repeat protein